MATPGRTWTPGPPKRGLSTIAIVSLVATAVLLILGTVAFMLWPGDPPSPDAPTPTRTGDPEARPGTETATPEGTNSPGNANPFPEGSCVFLTGTPEDPGLSPADCDDDGTDGIAYAVVRAHDGIAACGESMTQYTEYLGEVTTITLCLAEVLVEGACYTYTDSLAAVRRVECPSGDFRVAQLLDDAGATCASGQDQFSYAEWDRTYCLSSTG